MEQNKRFIVDLSQAQSPADIVFELSNVIENNDASNKRIWLKLGNVALNQSQILSINSLINSINSTLTLIESENEITEQSALALEISTKPVEEELQEEMSTLEPQAPAFEPSEQYIPMTEYREESVESVDDNDIENKVEYTLQEVVEDNNDFDYPQASTECFDALAAEVNSEEIQTELDSIFDSETKLENILSDEKDITSMQNWPLTKEEGDDFEIPEDVMTDEDYAILQMSTQYHKQTVRSGQVIQSNGNVVIIGDCHPGCEIHAAGDITVWGILGGIAHAGCNGNTKARIRALTLNAIQLRIADSFARRPDHIKNIYVEKSNTFVPEEARNVNGSIVILKFNDK